LIALFRQFFSNLFHIGAIQLTNMLLQFYLIALVISRVGIATNGLVLTALSLAWLACILLNYAGNQTIPLVFAKEVKGGDSRHAAGLTAGDAAGGTAGDAAGITAGVIARNTAGETAEVVTDNLSVRLLFFLVIVVAILILYALGVSFSIYLIATIPILFSELINPQAFYLSLNKMHRPGLPMQKSLALASILKKSSQYFFVILRTS
jgi:hypothetical protein